MNKEIEEIFRDKLYKSKIRYIPQDVYNRIKSKFEGLLIQNDEILDTIDVRILTDDYDDITVLLNVISVYPDIQSKILAMRPNEYKMFVSLIKGMDKADIDWIGIAEDLIDNLNSQAYRRVFEDPSMIKRINQLHSKYAGDDVKPLNLEDVEEIEQMAEIFTNGNMFDIRSYKDLRNLNKEKQYHDLLIGNKDNKYISSLTNEDKLKHVILLKRFGHGLDSAEVIVKRYFDDYDNVMKILDSEDESEISKYVIESRRITDPEKIKSEVKRIKKENEVLKSYLKALKEILDETDIEKLKNYYSDYKLSKGNQIYRIDAYLRKFFCREKNKSLYQTRKEDKIKIDSRDVYLVQDDFKISMTSLDSYSEALDLDVKKVKNHGLCTNIFANNNMNHAPIRGTCLAFTDYSERSLYASAPWDLASDRFATNMNISRAKIKERDEKFKGKVDIKFYTPDAQINMIRRRSGEDLHERRELDADKIDYENEKFKKQPAYVVYFSEESISNYLNGWNNEILTSENLKKYLDTNKLNDILYRSKLVEQYAKSDSKWSNPDPKKNDTLKEADKRNVDIVIVDRTYTALKERMKIDEIEKQILEYDTGKIQNSPEEKSKFFNLIEKLIVESENCRAGLSIRGDWNDGELNGKLIHEELREKLFSFDIMQDRLKKIETKIATLGINHQKDYYKRFIDISRNEILKYEHDVAYFEYEPGYDLKGYIAKYKAEITGRKTFNIQEALNDVDSRTGKSGGQIVCEAISDIRELDEYPASMQEIHGQKHINNVVLFSYLIAKGENTLDTEGIDLLVQAAKFHDVGRDGKWNGLGDGQRHDFDDIPHANPSALGAEFYMMKERNPDGSKKYSKEQIAIVQTAISYHEVHENRQNVFNEKKFRELCKKYGVSKNDVEKAKNICIYLKDADAVDRTRFMQDYEEDKDTIPEHKRYERRFYDGCNTSYLRTMTGLLLVDDARKIHKELLKMGCEHCFDKNGNYLNPGPLNTEIISVLEPYKDFMKNRAPKYKEATREENANKIEAFLLCKKKEMENKEQTELMNICRGTNKGILAKLRNLWKAILDKFRRVDDKER